MDINPDREKKLEGKIRAVNEVFVPDEKGLLILEKDGFDTKTAGRIMYTEIKEIRISHAGTLYDGSVSFILKSGGELKYRIKKFHQEDFEELKKKLGK